MIDRLKRLLDSRFRISTQLYLGIGGAVLMTMAASLVGWYSFDRVGNAQSRVNEGSVPELEAAFGVAQYSGSLVDAAPRLTVATTPEELATAAASIDEARNALEGHLTVLLGVMAQKPQQSIIDRVQSLDISGLTDMLGREGVERQGGEAERSEAIRAHVDTLIVSIDSIENDMYKLFELNIRKEALRAELEDLRVRVNDIMVPVVDDQLFYTMTGYQNLGDPPTARGEHFSEIELTHYRSLAGLHADATTANQLLESAFSISSAPLLEPLRERFESAAGSIERNLSALPESPLRARVAPLLTRLRELGIGEGNGFDLLERHLDIVKRQQDLLTLNDGIALALVREVDALVTTARANTQDATQASTQAILTGRTLLLAISAVSVSGALLIAWLFVGRVLLSRLQRLSDWMRRMAGGDLEAQVEIGGRDEVADMAAALEVFRQHALEVQRLNLVEKLAKDLEGKNDELEHVLEDLRKAQNQIIMREKLAALGEVTAGVAHEIRNPLNFVKNFSEASEELIDDLKETLTENAERLPEDDRSLIDEIAQDLTDNLDRIRQHGNRAERIVHDMLMMGRDSGEWQRTDINSLLDEHARLAYHSARAMNTEFQLDLKQDLDPDMGEVEVIPQDLGRVFLNMVSNAGYATHEKRIGRAASERAEPYMPTLWLTTRRGEDTFEVSIRDNGNGIPDEVRDKIFNPFFTTKPTDQGTGLGLSLCSDIVRRHGGVIRVESEPGEFTEMIVELPLNPPESV